VWQWLRSRHQIENADTLFTLRLLPILLALLVVVLVTLPSFWSLEPSASNEGIGWPIATLFAASMLWMMICSARIFVALRKASRFFALASPSVQQPSAYEIPGNVPNLFIAGLWRPRLFISRGAIELLDSQEMRAAIRHELAHTRAHDNLKQMAMRLCAFPALASLDKQWLRAAEIAADDRAVSDELGAAELAAALMKVGTASARLSLPALGMSLVPEADAPVSDRVRRLLDWKPVTNHRASRGGRLYLLLVPVAGIAFNLVWLMSQMHRFTELLFR
jgi:Zn-dependent protease with chaperone function